MSERRVASECSTTERDTSSRRNITMLTANAEAPKNKIVRTWARQIEMKGEMLCFVISNTSAPTRAKNVMRTDLTMRRYIPLPVVTTSIKAHAQYATQ